LTNPWKGIQHSDLKGEVMTAVFNFSFDTRNRLSQLIQMRQGFGQHESVVWLEIARQGLDKLVVFLP
jgi:hypothetical protein